jgi:hypothetical protein
MAKHLPHDLHDELESYVHGYAEGRMEILESEGRQVTFEAMVVCACIEALDALAVAAPGAELDDLTYKFTLEEATWAARRWTPEQIRESLKMIAKVSLEAM